MKLTFVLLKTIFVIYLTLPAQSKRVQRLIILNKSELKIVPKFEFPIQLRSMKSTFNLQLPIQLRATNYMQMRLHHHLRKFKNNQSKFDWRKFSQDFAEESRSAFHDNLLGSTALRWLINSVISLGSNGTFNLNQLSFQECIQKLMCQVTNIPKMHSDYGLFGDFIYLLFK